MFYAFMTFDVAPENTPDFYVGMSVYNVKGFDSFARLLVGDGADEEDAITDLVDTAYNEFGIDDMPYDVDVIMFETNGSGRIERAEVKALKLEASRSETVNYQTDGETYWHTLQYEG